MHSFHYVLYYSSVSSKKPVSERVTLYEGIFAHREHDVIIVKMLLLHFLSCCQSRTQTANLQCRNCSSMRRETSENVCSAE